MKTYAVFLLAVLFALAFPSRAGSPHTIVITCASSTVQVSTDGTKIARSMQWNAPTGNMGVVLWGDGTTSSTVGNRMTAGSGQYFAPDSQAGYPLSQYYVYCTTGDTLTVNWMD